MSIENNRVALGCVHLQCTLPPVWLRSYLIKFLIWNLSYIPCSEPSLTVLLLDVIFTMYARHPSLHNSPHFTAPFKIPPWSWAPLWDDSAYFTSAFALSWAPPWDDSAYFTSACVLWSCNVWGGGRGIEVYSSTGLDEIRNHFHHTHLASWP